MKKTYKNEVFLKKLIHVNIKNNNINKMIITAMAKNTSSNRSVFSQHHLILIHITAALGLPLRVPLALN